MIYFWAFLQKINAEIHVRAVFSWLSLSILISINAAANTGKPLSFYDIKLPSLSLFRKQSTNSLKGKYSAWVLFQNNCTSCEKQLNDLKCISRSINKVAVGFWASRKKLKKIITKTQFKGLSMKADDAFKKWVQLKQTPTVLIIDPHGQLIAKLENRISCENLNQLIN